MKNFIEKLAIFQSVASTESFTKAGDCHNITRSMISQHIQSLEQQLGVRLFNRSTRHVTLTGAGKQLLNGGQQLLHDYENLLASVQSQTQQLTGCIRIGMQSDIGFKEIIPLIHDFQKIHPKIQIEAFLTDTISDLKQNNFDMSFRISVAQRPNTWGHLYGVGLKEIPALLCASPDYFKHRAMPTTLEELAQCDWVIPTMLPTPYDWTLLDKNEQPQHIHVNGKLKVNTARALYRAMTSGAGISVALTDFVEEELSSGKLIRVMTAYRVPPRHLYLVYAEKQFMPARNRAFIDFVKAHYGI